MNNVIAGAKKYKNWLLIALIIVVVPLGCTGLANYIIDPYGFFRKDFTYQFEGTNDNLIKTRYVTDHPDRYDCFVFGSSRVNRLDVRKIHNEHCYNLSFPAGLPRNHLDNLKYMLAKGVKIKTILIGLDEFSWKGTVEDQLMDHRRHPYPPAINEKLLPYYMQYLFSSSNNEVLKKVWKPYWERWLSGEKRTPQYDIETGLLLLPEVERFIQQNLENHIKDPKFSHPVLVYMGAKNLEGALEDIRSIVAIARTHKIHLIFFINPIHKTTYLASNLDGLFLFEKGLSSITDYWDFSGLNSITTNNYYFHEPSHYRSMVGDMVLARTLGDKTVKIPSDFGVFVTAANVDKHLEQLKKQVKEQ